MGQYFKIIDLDLMVMLSSMGKLGENVTTSFASVIHSICEAEVPAAPKPEVSSSPPRLHTSSPETSGVTSFHDLPPEILIVVFEQTETYYDALFLALTCSTVWLAGESLLRKRYVELVAPCRGHRLINLGDYAERLPSHLSTQDQVQRMVETLGWTMSKWNALPDDDDGTGEDDTPQDTTDVAEPPSLETSIKRICGYAYYKTQSLRSPSDAFANLKGWKQRRQLQDESDNIPGASEWLEPSQRFSYRKGITVLRNLSKKVYVRSDTFSIDGSDPVWGFGRALVFHISWSTDPSTSMSFRGLTRGEWAGDRFDVVTLQSFQADEGDAGWTDVTQEVKERMVAIAESEYGEDWEMDAAW